MTAVAVAKFIGLAVIVILVHIGRIMTVDEDRTQSLSEKRRLFYRKKATADTLASNRQQLVGKIAHQSWVTVIKMRERVKKSWLFASLA